MDQGGGLIPSPDAPPSGPVRYRVSGWSMWPAISDGATITVVPAAQCAAHGHPWPPEPGAIVVARHPFRRGTTIVKRVAARHQDGKVELRGDSPIESEDSGTLGLFSVEDLLGRVTGL